MSASPYQLKSDPYSSHALILRTLGEGQGRRALDVGAAAGHGAILAGPHRRFSPRRTFVGFLEDAGLTVTELASTPVPLPLVVPPRLHGALLDAIHATSAAAARVWPGGLAYQLVAVA